MAPAQRAERTTCTKCSSADIQAGKGGSIPTWHLVGQYERGTPPTCRKCGAPYPRPAQHVFAKHRKAVSQAVEAVASTVQRQRDPAGNSNQVKKLQEQLAAARREAAEHQRLLRESEARVAAQATATSPADATEAAGEGPAIAALSGRIDDYERKLKDEDDPELKKCIQNKITALRQERTELQDKRDAGKPHHIQWKSQAAKVDKAKAAWDRALAQEAEREQALKDAQQDLRDAQVATKEAADRHEEASAALAKLAKKAAEPAEPAPFDPVAALRAEFKSKGVPFDQAFENALAAGQAAYTKAVAAAQEAAAAAASKLPPDDNMGVGLDSDGLPSAVSTEQLAWLNRQPPPRTEGTTDEQYDKILLEWAKSAPAGAPASATAPATGGDPGSSRGRTTKKEEEKAAEDAAERRSRRSRSRASGQG